MREDALFRRKSEAAVRRIASIETGERETLERNFIKAIGAREARTSVAKVYADDRQETADRGKLAKIREKFPNANRAWSEEDDNRLRTLFEDEKSTKELAKIFGRKGSAIMARLAKLGLIEEGYWMKKGSRHS